MAQWEDLTQEEQQLVSGWMDQLLRPMAGQLARSFYQLDVVKAAYVGPAAINTIVASLDQNAVIPNTSGLAGAVDVTKAQLDPVLTALNSLLTGYYTEDDLERYVALAGGANVIGG